MITRTLRPSGQTLLTQHNLQLSINTYVNTSANEQLHQQLLQQLNMNASLLPPPALTYSTVNIAIQAVKDWARIHHYAIVQQRSKKRKRDEQQYKIYMHCDHGGKYRPRIAKEDYHQRKKTSS